MTEEQALVQRARLALRKYLLEQGNFFGSPSSKA